jgi:hypothetical protein
MQQHKCKCTDPCTRLTSFTACFSMKAKDRYKLSLHYSDVHEWHKGQHAWNPSFLAVAIVIGMTVECVL